MAMHDTQFDRPGRARLAALVVLAVSLAPLLVAAGLDADPRGMGTHTQLGLAPCGFDVATGLPCATCGMTTAFTHAAHGHLVAAFAGQPAGALLALGCAMLTLTAGWALWRGASLAPLGRAVWRPAVVVTLIAVVLGAWGYTAGRAMWT